MKYLYEMNRLIDPLYYHINSFPVWFTDLLNVNVTGTNGKFEFAYEIKPHKLLPNNENLLNYNTKKFKYWKYWNISALMFSCKMYFIYFPFVLFHLDLFQLSEWDYFYCVWITLLFDQQFLYNEYYTTSLYDL